MTDKSPMQAALDKDVQITELAREVERLRAALKRVEYWLDTDQEVLDEMSPDERRAYLELLQMVRAALKGE